MSSISIVIPALNEEKSILEVLEQVIAICEEYSFDYEIIVVDDGSTDRTASLAIEFAKNNKKVRVLRHTKTVGSGEAIYTGIKNSCKELVMYIPADGQFEVSEIPLFIKAAENADIVLGTRSSREDYSLFRKINSKLYLFLARILFGLKYRDINWVHLWRKEIFDRFKISSKGVAFLLEIVVKAKKSTYKIAEVFSVYRPRIAGKAKGSKLKSVFRALKEIICLYFKERLAIKK